ncbi:DnaJ-class molecular chaperone with C-terminal Zn finger domain [Candidatus Methanoperedens nitroreducens]|uniref:DnaJ-class molecular chaperone with C-terminal Zn finger domain n=1 Tax=Candidatus Methanoperedens nitratireducens TaxID=1392998 RepID=A0A062VD09_9EURY|nr:cytochrome c3 family protein [Candidatus Methanoperedens nitroreducens]KCZ73534.1 DnaJ-class molecular chaperone with C-terminal Zn finger domain [Candidatus Methanoperedens nitroreducens]MDJ1422508.1 cytochrome c3 family protein [Candidatus Methanoperedens sp.]
MALIGMIKNFASTYKLPIAVISIVLFSTVFVVSEKALDITENPSFCGKNCHIMRPYYDSWRTSSHNDVACVECHYEPGLIGHAKGKINGLIQFYNYQTTVEEYSGRLYAKVMDKNCLTCHEKRIYSSDIGYMGVNFSHKNHLLQPKRGVGVTCTSCHSMLVIGMKEHQSVTDPSCNQCHPNIVNQDVGHIVVTTSSCFTCHFRDVSGNTSISGCPSCHGPPKETHKNYTNFNHTSHVNKGYECVTCHTNISTGANDIVLKNKCYSCHSSRDRVERYDDFSFLHKKHVTTNKIACYECHSNVKHIPTIKENLCTTCHSQEHPGDWLTTHKKEVLIGKVCSNCHQPRFCSDCHATGVASGKKEK